MFNVLEGNVIVAQLKQLAAAETYAQRINTEQGRDLWVDRTARTPIKGPNEWCNYR